MEAVSISRQMGLEGGGQAPETSALGYTEEGEKPELQRENLSHTFLFLFFSVFPHLVP